MKRRIKIKKIKRKLQNGDVLTDRQIKLLADEGYIFQKPGKNFRIEYSDDTNDTLERATITMRAAISELAEAVRKMIGDLAVCSKCSAFNALTGCTMNSEDRTNNCLIKKRSEHNGRE